MTEPRIIKSSNVGMKDGIRFCEKFEYPFIYSDGGRSISKRPKQKNDCTVRAVADTFGLSYDEVYDNFKLNGRQCSKGFNFSWWLLSSSIAGGRVDKMSFPATKGQRRMNPSTFCKQYNKGKYICRTAKHVFAVIDGIVYDTWEQRPDRCIYTAWEVL